MEEEMPKMKTKSSVKKRFKVSGTGKIIGTQSGKQHNMRKRTKRQLRAQRGPEVVNDINARRIRNYAPYSL
jgi:large subunit ribosomal protein L35